MSGSTKFLMFAIALVVAAIGYLAADNLGLMRASQTPAPAKAPAAAPPPAAGAQPAPAAGASDPTVKKAYDDCVGSAFPTRADAEKRAAACSAALQSRQLKPDEIAMARLTRGIARTALGDKVLAGEDYVDAVQRYDSLINPANPDALALYRRAAALNASGQTDKALDDYSAAIKADPKASLAFLARGVLLAVRKRSYDRSIEDFDKVLVLEPDNVEALISRGDVFSQLGDSARAMVDLNRAVALAPGNALVLLARGQAETRRNNLGGALRDYREALKVEPRNASALSNIAAIDLLQGRFQDAVRDLDEAIAIESDNPLAYYNRGLTRAILGTDLVQALADTDEALKLLPINLEVRDTRGFVYLKLGDPALALNEYNAALGIDPNRAISLYGRGLAKIRMGDAAGGKNDQEAALTINPEVAQDFAIYSVK